MRRLLKFGPTVVVLGVLLVGLASPAQAAPPPRTVPPVDSRPATNTIYNWTYGTGIGVIRVADNDYLFGNYDAALPGWQATWQDFQWTTTAGFYVGPGYCVNAFRHDHGLSGAFTFQGTFGAGRHYIGANTSYILEARRC